jgi:hypothetical protein
MSGAGHTTGAMFSESGVHLFGDPARYSVVSEAGNRVTRLFCGTCGSPLFGMNTGMPGVMTVTLGTLDESDPFTPQVAIFMRSRRKWDVIDTSVATFDAQPSWKPADPV